MMEVLGDEMVAMEEMIVYEDEEIAFGGDLIGSEELLSLSRP